MSVKPRDAASLVLFRGNTDNPLVLMGKRAETMRFMPGYYVFPGGTVDDTDIPASAHLSLNPATSETLSRHADRNMHKALAWAAVRETWEETGLFFGHARAWPLPASDCAGAQAFHSAGIEPGTALLEFFARAVTPKEVSMRFDSRFFIADGAQASGTIRSNGELQDVAWHRAEFALAAFPMAHISRFVLARALAIWCENLGKDGRHRPRDRAIARFTQRHDRFSMKEDSPDDPPQIDPEGLDWP